MGPVLVCVNGIVEGVNLLLQKLSRLEKGTAIWTSSDNGLL